MSILTDSKYIGLISSRLERFKKRKNNLYTFRCPVCGDSKKDTSKTRGNFYQYKDSMWFNCYNGCPARPFSVFLEGFDSVLYEEYMMENFGKKLKNNEEEEELIEKSTPKPKFSSEKATKPNNNEKFFSSLTPVHDLLDIHPVKQYVTNRRIPLDKVFLVAKFKEWTNSLKPNTFETTKYDTPRLIIPFLDENGNVFAYQGRSFDPKDPNKYITIKLDESMPKVYGLNSVDKNKTVYVVEGPIDSMFGDNFVAASGGDLGSVKMFKDTVYIFDNEPRKPEIVKKIKSLIRRGEKVVIWGKQIPEGSDINDLILGGFSKSYIMNHIRKRTFKGVSAELEFIEWSKIQ